MIGIKFIEGIDIVEIRIFLNKAMSIVECVTVRLVQGLVGMGG